MGMSEGVCPFFTSSLLVSSQYYSALVFSHYLQSSGVLSSPLV